MLKIEPNIRFTTTAHINLKGLQCSFVVECLLLHTDRLEHLRQEQAERKITTENFTKEWLVGWPAGQVQDVDGSDMPFSHEAVDKLLKVPGAPMALLKAFYDGYDEATEGNSAPLPAGS
ncbi:MAG: hypothetical protein Q7U99_12370 [Rubrivivax sp.]|nr:hypothetical protein [Rubrivivax sp.]MDP3222525.1 hypothetical protein [Rubrivivax sp.]